MAMDGNSFLLGVSEQNKCYEVVASPQTLKTFHPFRKLPTELRVKIWKLVPDDRLIEVYWNSKKLRFMTFNAVPSTLQVCQESRHLALKTYKLMKFPVKMDYTNGVRFNPLVTDGEYCFCREPPLPRSFEIIQTQKFSTYIDYSRDAIAISCIHHFKLQLDNRPNGPLFDFIRALCRSSKLQKQLRIAVCFDFMEYYIDEFIDIGIHLFSNLQELIFISPQAYCDRNCHGCHKIVDFEKQESPRQPSKSDVDELWKSDSADGSTPDPTPDSTPYWEQLQSRFGYKNDSDQYWMDLKISCVKVVRKA